MSLFPEWNYAAQIRNLDTNSGDNFQTTTLVLPRPKYTWFCEFQFSPGVLVGNYTEAFRTGKILAAMIGMDHPQVSVESDKMVAYNKVRVVPRKMNFKSVTIHFHDDATSFVTGLWKTYRRHYSYLGDVQDNQQFGDRLVSATDDTGTGTLPSLGMKVRPVRHFFDEITIYDLGTAPNSINIYHLVKPSIIEFSHAPLDYTERTGMVDITWTCEVEGYWEELGQNIQNYSTIFTQIGKDFEAFDGFFVGLGQFQDINQVLSNVIGQVAGAVQLLPSFLSKSLVTGFSASLFAPLGQVGPDGFPIPTVASTLATASQPPPPSFFQNQGSNNQLGPNGNLPFQDNSAPQQPFQSPDDATASATLAVDGWDGADV